MVNRKPQMRCVFASSVNWGWKARVPEYLETVSVEAPD
jgi:hypothetical protein